MINPEIERSGELLASQQNRIAVLNLGSQHTLEIQDVIERSGVHADVLPYDTPAEQLSGYGGLVLSGGQHSVYDEGSPKIDPAIIKLKKPIYGICYGAQLLAQQLGGTVSPGSHKEFGQYPIHRANGASATGVMTGAAERELVWMNHGDAVTTVPDGFEVAAYSENGIIAGFHSTDGQIIGVQFHPEISGPGRTELGDDLFARFLFDVAKIEPTFEPQTVDARIAAVAEQVGTRHVLMFLSGGVDSSVMAKLVQAGVPKDQIHAVFIDHGFMRTGEIEQVRNDLTAEGIEVQVYDAKEYFLDAKTIIDGLETAPLRFAWKPEEKRKIIGDAFMRVQSVVADELQLPSDYLLAQGSIRPDLIESGSHGGDTIKTHHNDSPLARELRAQGRLLEPIADLYKPGVRALGRSLELSEKIVRRQPFPGPGIAIRVLCEVRNVLSTAEMDQLVATRDSIGIFATDGLHMDVLPVRSVGQQGDGRRYGQTVVLSGDENWPLLASLAKRIPERAHDVTRVTYAFGEQIAPFSLGRGLVRTLLGDGSVEQLRRADFIVRQELTRAGLDSRLQQVPVILLPHSIDRRGQGKRSIVLRPFLTTNFMTGIAAQPGTDEMPLYVVHSIVDRILDQLPEISRVLYDLTGKPPGTTEWE